MAVYRFKVAFEDNEDVYREIEIKSTQTFEDFHNIIIQSIGFDNIHDASFFISDDYWRKGDEIGLRPLSDDETEKLKRKDLPVKKQMSKCKLASMIEDPHQKFVYVYDPKTAWTFLIELVKILLDDAKGTFPKCTKTVGESPKQYKNNGAVPVVDEDEFDEDEPHLDDEAYVNAHAEDETALLEGEEGEEEEMEGPHDDEDMGDADDHPEPSHDED